MLGNYGNIANTQVADIAGALDIRQKKLDADEAKRKEIRTNQLISEGLTGLRDGSPVKELFKTDPQKAAFLAKATGIPLNDGERLQAMVDDTHAIAKLAGADPEGAIQYAATLSAQRKEMGVDTAKLDSWLQLAQQDSGKAIRAMQMADKTFNDDIYRKREIEDRKLSQQDRSLDLEEKRLSSGAGGQNAYFTPIQTADGVYAFNARTGGLSQGLDSTGKPVKSAAADVNLQADLTGAKAAASNEADRKNEAKKGINRSEQLMSNIEEAEKLIPKATGSYAGAARDIAGRLVGVSTDKSEASAKLDTLAGWMVANVPRMEGPQSNIDVQNYQTMAAKVGDRTIPTDERLAALSVLKKLQAKYSDLNKDIAGDSTTKEVKKSKYTVEVLP